MMFSAIFVSLAILAGSVTARPLARATADVPTDTQVLNYALTLEHLENAFYAEALAKFSRQDFKDAGLPDFAYGRFLEILSHEKTHVDFLTAALGENATKPCTYSFPITDPKSFVTISRSLETVGTSAYVGASKFIQNKDYLLAAATILTTEARQSAWIDSAVRKSSAWSGPFETPLDMNQVFSIASGFITSCPSSNPPLPVKAFPTLKAASGASAAPGKDFKLDFAHPADASTKLYGAFLSGQNALIVPVGADGSVSVPSELRGTVYLLLTSDANGVSDDSTVAGPLMLDFPYDSFGNLITLPF